MNMPPLVLIHGFPFDHTMWDHVSALLSPDINVLAPDLRGFGNRPLGSDEPSLDRMADDIALLLEEQRLPRAVVAGMSMGGYVALSFAARYSDRLAGLGLISSQALADSDDTRTNRRSLIEKVRREGILAATQPLVPKLFAPANKDKPELVRFPIYGAEQAGVDGICWALEAMARRPDRTSLLSALQAPVLIVQGLEDQIILRERSRELVRHSPTAELVELPEVGHASPLEAPTDVANALKTLVRRCAM